MKEKFKKERNVDKSQLEILKWKAQQVKNKTQLKISPLSKIELKPK
jgi:hypothetical protein